MTPGNGETPDAKRRRTVYRHGLLTEFNPVYSTARLRALAAMERMPVADGLAWVEAGPDGLRNGDPPSVMGVTPRTGLVQDIHQGAGQVWCATAQGGLWKGPTAIVGTDQAWEPVTDALPSLAVNTVVGLPAAAGRPDLLLLGMGDPYSVGDNATGWWGLWRSIDGGRSFHPLNGGPGASRFFNDDINEILPIDADRWLVATRTGLYWTQDGGRNFGANATADDDRPLDTGNVLDVRAIVSAAPQGFDAVVTYAIAGVGLRRFYVPSAGLPQHTAGAGTAWEYQAPPVPLATGTTSPGSIAFDHAVIGGVDRMVVSVAATNTSLGVHAPLGWGTGTLAGPGVWSTLSSAGLTTLGRESQCSFNHVAYLDPGWHTATSSALFYVGAVNLLRGRVGTGGTLLGSGVLESAEATGLHNDHHALTSAPGVGAQLDGTAVTPVYSGNDGGAASNDSAGQAPWRQMGRASTMLTYACAALQNGSNLVLAAGFQDNGSAGGLVWTGVEGAPVDPLTGPQAWSWASLTGGDGGRVTLLPDPNTPGRTWIFTLYNDWLYRARRDELDPDWTLDPPGTVLPAPTNVNFSGVLTKGLDATGAWSILVVSHCTSAAGGAQIRVCTTAFGALTSAGFQPVTHPSWSSPITAMLCVPTAPSPAAWNGLWIGHLDGTVRFCGDIFASSPSFADRTPPGNRRPVTAIAMDPRDAQVVAVTVGGFAGRPSRWPTRQVWLYTGTTAPRDISGREDADTNLPDMPALGVVILGTEPRRILVSNELGVFLRTGDVDEWSRVEVALARDGGLNRFRRLPRVPVYALAAAEDPHPDPIPMPRVAAATFGRSLWLLLDLARHSPAGVPSAIPALVAVFDGAFGLAEAASPRARSLVVHNRGAAAGSVAEISVTGSGWSVDGGALSNIALVAGGMLTRQVHFQPGAPGVYLGELRITSGSGEDAPIVLPLSAEVVAQAPGRLAVLDGDVIDFGTVDSGASTRTAKVRIRNAGGARLTLRSVRVEDASHVRVLDAPAGLDPDEEADLRVVLDNSGLRWSPPEGTLVIEPETGPARQIRVRGGGESPAWVQALAGIGIGVLIAAVGAGLASGIAYAATRGEANR